MSEILQAEYPVKVSNLEKLMWPEAKVSKADFISYCIHMAPYLLKHYKNRPLTVIRFPHGIQGESFYQKNAPNDTPEWVTTYPVWSDERNGNLHYILIDSTATLIWLANQAALEWHPWYSTCDHPDYPNVLAFDLDPTVPGFARVRKVALVLRDVLGELGWPSVAKTSGSSGLAVYVPIKPNYQYSQTRIIMHRIAQEVHRRLPLDVTLERFVKNRRDLVYFDYLQHAPQKTLIGVYSPRSHPKALISTPVTWAEIEAGVEPTDFSMLNYKQRIEQVGDLFELTLSSAVSLDQIFETKAELDASKFNALK